MDMIMKYDDINLTIKHGIAEGNHVRGVLINKYKLLQTNNYYANGYNLIAKDFENNVKIDLITKCKK